MTLLTWGHACTVGVQAMDDQHAILMDTMNELRLAQVRGNNRDERLELLNRLLEFTRMHFWSEEQLMEQHGFPGLDEHREEHERLLAKMRAAVQRAHHGEELQLRPLLNFLRNWYLDHIEGMDRLYAPWLNERGIY